MRVIVTGAGGFIGSFLCEQLCRDGHEVIRIFRRLPDAAERTDKSGENVEADVRSGSFPSLRLPGDAVIHLAAANDIISKNGHEGLSLSILGTKNVLDFAVNNRIPRMIFFSTIQVLGSELAGEYSDESAMRPENDYAANHAMAEIYTEMYARKGLLQAVSIRPTNVYGHFAYPTINRWSLVPACLCKEAFFEKAITIRSSGRQRRNFISVHSVARATSAILNRFPATYDTVNLGSPLYMTIQEAARCVKQVHDELYGEPARLILQGDEPQQENRFYLSLGRLEDRYGFREHLGAEDFRSQISLLFHQLERSHR
ncbi:NAD(P)-dependent oxidoreductase [Paenibacillus sp. HN-1]|uniref:NAD-dependent epimerase/dehydratase family protein n=1 Tax=Paenibacillus TaxID=44249 RepID=UPI001CAA3D0C|nr:MULTISPECIES: NAD(P)-dependent oxidoreductase [Paenibacillus]MBY9078658.1 NAD(P)-dependent oxidoreductase [Paenibacillus sp. CGMCC 1.18879]MBY9084194.1 NAD(P)-dependent oxidoreductase [Paenibacillus sinensis]